MSSITDNNINELLERRQTRSGTPLGGRSSAEKTTGSNQKRSSLRQRTRAQTGNDVSTITEVIETQTTEVVFTENSVTTDTVDIRSIKGRQKKSVSVERTKNAEGANSVAATVKTVTHREPQLYKATRRLFDQKEEEKNEYDELLADSTTRESQAFDYSSYSSDDGSGKPLRAYDIYKRAGEYWNVFPKTDFTYSPTSEDRREIAPGVINIPNMSRRGIHHHEGGRLRSPTRYHTVTTSSSVWSKHSTPRNIPASKLKFWSSLDSDEDEVDSEVRRRHRLYMQQQSSRLTTVKNFFARYLTTIWTVITSVYAGAVEKASQAFGYRSHSSAVHSRHIAAVSERSTFHSWIIHLFSKLWDVSSWIFTTEVWLATLWNAGDKEGESSSAVGLRSRKYRRLLWLMLIPFLIIAGLGLASSFEKLPTEEVGNVWETVTQATENWIYSLPLPAFKMSQEREDGKQFSPQTLPASPPSAAAQSENIIDVEKISHVILSSPEFQKLVLLSTQKEANETAQLAKELHSKNLLLMKQELHGAMSSEVERLRAQLDQLSANFEELERKKPEPHVLVDPYSRLWRHKLQDLGSRIKLLQEQQTYLKRQMTTCCSRAPPAFPAIQIEEHVTKFLSGLFGSEVELERNLPGVLTWLQKLFVAKEELELRLANVTADMSAKVNKNIIKASKTSANMIMDIVAEQIKQEFVKQKEEMELSWKGGKEREEDSSSSSTVVGGAGLSHEQVQRIVDSALAKYDADKTGMVDYALESSGGSILGVRCTENYQANTARFSILGLLHWYPSAASPRTVIQPGVNPGNCWAFAGAQGYLVIKLSGWVQLSAFSLEHIPRSLSPTGRIDSAPKDFRVFGLRDEQDEFPLEIGRFRYQENGTSLQYFKVQRTDLPPFNIVELRVESNHGNMDYTCLYRFRVHGVRVTKKGSDE